MSEPVAPLGGAVFAGRVDIAEVGPLGMVTLRADLGSATVRSAVGRALGLDVPAARAVTEGAGRSLLWMSPDELLVTCAYAEAPSAAQAARAALAGVPHLAAVVSDARVVFDLTGPEIRNVLTKLTPADLRPRALPVGALRRTRLAQVPAAFWLTSESAARLIAFRSVADYVLGLLKDAADPAAGFDHH